MLAPWAQQEVAEAGFNDARLNKRLTRLLSDLGSRPTASIPAACGTAAAYRFFENDKVSPEKILQPHYEQALVRMAEQKVVLLVQDTSELDLTRPQQQVKDAGPLDTEARRGGFSPGHP